MENESAPPCTNCGGWGFHLLYCPNNSLMEGRIPIQILKIDEDFVQWNSWLEGAFIGHFTAFREKGQSTRFAKWLANSSNLS